MKNFWQKLNRPFFCLAPMSDVTDTAFRQMFVKYGKPDVLFTEFVSADGLASDIGRPKLLRELYYTETERPIVAQIFGANPKTIRIATKLIKDLGFDGVDINLGCPDRAVEKQGAGSALIKNPQLAQEIILTAKRGAGDMPVSVKTRLGYNKLDTENWAKTLLKAKPEAITFHLRTRKEMSKAPAHYEELPKIMEIFKNSGIIIIANGDIKNVEEGKKLVEQYGLDGVMIGRGAFGKPDLFASLARSPTSGPLEVGLPAIEARLKIMLEHTQLFYDLYGPTEKNKKLFNGHTKNFAVIRKHFKAYASGFKGATALRTKLMQTQNPAEVEAMVTKFLNLL